ncbi:MAG: BatA domain-containing protein, partial [Rubricoccaceae bacterium]|nr:BatA domain-containing protein [Rubricoccaceae bacterium]
MTFLNPLVLFGLVAAAIPLIIHLFNFRKPKRVDFSSLTFLHELEKTTMRRVQIKQWLLLLLRTLAIACLVLAFAQPIQTSTWEGLVGDRAPSSIALVVDNSMSMTMRDGQGAYIDQAKALAEALAQSIRENDELYFIPVQQGLEEPVTSDMSGELVQDAIENLANSYGSATLLDGIAQAASLLENAGHPRREMFVISDLQSATLADSSESTFVAEDIQVTLLPVGGRSHTNIALTDLSIQSQIIEAGRPVQVSAEVTSFGGDAESYGVSVFLEGERVAQTAVDLTDGAPEAVDLTFTPPRSGWLRGEVRVEPDEADWDDARHFVLHVPDTRRVLVVRGESARADHVTIALNIASESGALQVVTVDERNVAGADINSFSTVVLVGPTDLSTGEESLLNQYVRDGGGLIVFAGEQVEATNGLLRALGGGTFTGLLEGANDTSIGGFGRTELEHPLFDGLFDTTSGTSRIESPEVFRAGNYAPGGGNESSLIRLAGGTPFLQEIRSGSGLTLLYAVAPDQAWSDFPVRGLFAPLMYRSVV